MNKENTKSGFEGRVGMYRPSLHYAIEQVQEELESYLKDYGKVFKAHVVKDKYKEQDIFVYTVFDKAGKEVGEISFLWKGGFKRILTNTLDKNLENYVEAFGDTDKKIKEYEEEWNRKIRENPRELEGLLLAA